MIWKGLCNPNDSVDQDQREKQMLLFQHIRKIPSFATSVLCSLHLTECDWKAHLCTSKPDDTYQTLTFLKFMKSMDFIICTWHQVDKKAKKQWTSTKTYCATFLQLSSIRTPWTHIYWTPNGHFWSNTTNPQLFCVTPCLRIIHNTHFSVRVKHSSTKFVVFFNVGLISDLQAHRFFS